MVAALAAADAGASVLVLEKQALIGGSTCMSGGVVWIPNNPLMQRGGVADSYEDAMAHFEAVVGDVGPASSTERRARVPHRRPGDGRRSSSSCGVRFVRCAGYSDYYSNLPGRPRHRARRSSRCRATAKVLGDWLRAAAAGPGAERRPGGDDQRVAVAVALQPQRALLRRRRPRRDPHLRRQGAAAGAADERRVADRADAARRARPRHPGLDRGAARRPRGRGRPGRRRAHGARRQRRSPSAPGTAC